MAGLMEFFSRPELWQWVGGVGGGLSRAGRGQGFDISGANQQLFQGMADRRSQEQLNGLMSQFNLTPQQTGLMGQLPLQMQQKAYYDLAFPNSGEQTDFTRMLGMLTPEQQAQAVEIRAGLQARAQPEQRDPAIVARIDQLMQSGVDENTARGIATNRLRITTNPITGERAIIDMATGQPYDYGGGAGAGAEVPPPPPQVPPESLYDQAGEATGVVPGLKALSTDTLGQLPDWAGGGLFQFPDTVEAQQTLTVATNDLIRSLSVNPRFPVAEMERIMREIGIAPGMTTSETGMQSRMTALDKYLRNRMEFERQAAADPNLPADQRQIAIASARNINQFLGLLQVPQEATNPWGAGAPPTGYSIINDETGVEMIWDGEAWVPNG
jgi:hypothetical protein